MPEPVIVGSDHAGYELKEKVKQTLDRLGVPFEDVGTHSARAVAAGRYTRGILVCGTGIGVSIAANRHAGVRAAVACTEETARLSREHNDANVLALGGRTVPPALAERMVEVWLSTPFAGGRHARRVAKIEPGPAGAEVRSA
jgi:ribose 5-phosphate isomerase B